METPLETATAVAAAVVATAELAIRIRLADTLQYCSFTV